MTAQTFANLRKNTNPHIQGTQKNLKEDKHKIKYLKTYNNLVAKN